MDIIKILQEELGIRRGQVETTIKLIDEGNTIPFIARYRKEMTGSLDDETLRNFHERLLYLRNLGKTYKGTGKADRRSQNTGSSRGFISSIQTEETYQSYDRKGKRIRTISKSDPASDDK